MKAVAVKCPGEKPTPGSVHLAELPEPSITDIPPGQAPIRPGHEVLVEVLQIGVDATDREINDGLYGAAPEGYDFLVLGHESFGRVIDVGSNVTKVRSGDYVSCTVRRPGGSIYDDIGRNDITSEEVYYERGINLRHGYLTEKFVDDEEFIVRVPDELKGVGVLAEPASVVAKGLEQAFLAQQRLQVWEPKVGFVLGSGQIGILAAMFMRLRGMQVFVFARSPAEGNLKAEIVHDCGATYVSTSDSSPQDIAAKYGKPDMIFEATGSSWIAFDAMTYLNLNGVLIWSSITGGENTIEIPANRINLEWVLGNKLLVGTVNGNWKHFDQGITDLAMSRLHWPGSVEKILTHKIDGLENYQQMMDLLEGGKCLKVFVEVATD